HVLLRQAFLDRFALHVLSAVVDADGLADFFQRFLRDAARGLAAFHHDGTHPSRVGLVLGGALANGRELFLHLADHAHLAVDATDTRGRAAFPDPLAGVLVGIHLVEVPHRALLGIARIGTAHA